MRLKFLLTVLILTGILSLASKQTFAATFTVNETGDQVDFSVGDGSCDRDNGTPGSQCTLRAAIAEANALAGTDNIHFNIPTSDSGFRDYDDPNTPSSGDSTGGDDYWTIRPATSITAPSEAVIIDGSAQRINQGDLNTFGPEIEIKSQVTINSTNVTLNELVINGQVSGEYAILSAVNISGFTLTNSYLGVDVKSLADATAATQGIRHVVGLSTNITIGNTTSDGNVIAGFGSAIDWTCNSSGTQTLTVRGNKIGLGQTGNLIGNTSSGMNIAGGCVMEIGGPSSTHRNYLSGTPRGINPLNISNSQIKIRNNFFGTDLTGTQNRANTAGIRMDLVGTLFTLPDNKVIVGGAPGEGNLFRFSTGDGFRVEANKSFEISYNTFADNGRGITVGSDTSPTYEQVRGEIYNNFIGASTSDPYFGLNVGGNSFGIYNRSASPQIKGNSITGNLRHGIFNITTVNQSRTSFLSQWISRPQIGGTSSFTGSLCGGTEKNCISSNLWSGISSLETIPINEATLYTDNDFTVGNGTGNNRNIEQVWLGLFEIFSGTNRRTDLSSPIITLPSNLQIRTGDDPSTIVTTGTGTNLTCLNGAGAGCPASGHTIGTLDNTKILVPPSATLSNSNNWFRVIEYIIDSNGVKINYDQAKFESSHQASNSFTYDGESTDNIINTGSARTLNSQNYTDRGEPWTNLPSASRNIATGDLGRFQVMEVEYVDANPIFNGSEWIITVDSTTDEDNVSTCGFNDGSGAYSGGGCGGINGLPDGKTSFREAILVANQFIQPTRIIFNIPTTDTGWNTPQFPNAFRILFTGSGLELIRANTIIDGTSQTSFTGDTSTIINEPATMPVVGNATRGPEIVFDFSSNTIVTPFRLNAANIIVDSLGFYNNPINMRRGLTIFAPATNAIVRNCDFVNNEGGISASPGNVGLLLQNNVIRNNAQIDYRFDGIESDLSNAIIENNQFISNGGAGIGIQQPSSSSQNIIIRNNLIKANGFSPTVQSPGIIVAASPPGPPTIEIYNVEIYNNTIVGNSNHGIMIADGVNYVNIYENINYGSTLNPIELADLLIDFNAITGDGVTVNDSGDIDEGPNNLMNHPVIQSVTYLGAGQYRISGDIDGNVSEGPFSVEVCESDNHNSGHGGCIRSLGTTTNSPWSVNVTISGDNGTQNRVFSALATNSLGSTSEFSENFITAGNVNYTFQTYPIVQVTPIGGVVINDVTPILDWNSNSDPDIDHYEIYIDGVFAGLVPGNVTEFQVPSSLSPGEHTWQVIAFRSNGSQSGTSIVSRFTITEDPALVTPPASYPVPISYPDVSVTTPISNPIDNSPQEANDLSVNIVSIISSPVFLSIAPLVVALLSISASSLIAGQNIFGILFGALIAKKKKYWGIVFDKDTSKPLAFAAINIYDSNNRFITQTVSDLKGRYGVFLDKAGYYRISAKLTNYIEASVDIEVVDVNNELAIDIPMTRLDGKPLSFRENIQSLTTFTNYTVLILMFIGLAYSIYTAFRFPVFLNIFIVICYFIVLGFNIFLTVKHYYENRLRGKVIDLKGNPVRGASVRFYNESGQVDVILTNINGEIKLDINPGDYKVNATKAGYKLESSEDFIDATVTDNGYIDQKISMSKTSSAQNTAIENPF
jgi:hypothetical protein